MLRVSPCIPSEWKEYSMRYKHGDSIYNIKVLNPNGKVTGVERLVLNGDEVENKEVRLEGSGGIYNIEVYM